MKFSLESWLVSLSAIASVASAAPETEGGSIISQEAARQLNQSLLWGSYRPNLYFGVRPRLPKSFMGGLMWAKVENYADVQHCELFLLVILRPKMLIEMGN